jgi:hypothetical protein
MIQDGLKGALGSKKTETLPVGEGPVPLPKPVSRHQLTLPPVFFSSTLTAFVFLSRKFQTMSLKSVSDQRSFRQVR